MATSNAAIWLNEDGSLSARTLQTPREPAKGQAKVRVFYSGINPADTKHAVLGVYTTVTGYDFCGIVEDVGEGCQYQIGDTIAGYTPTGVGRPDHFGTHQNTLLYPQDDLAWHVPATMRHQDAACLTTIVRTAADALFNLMHYPLPAQSHHEKIGPLLIWGGSTSLGISAIQFAKSIGVSPIIVTASPQQHDLLTKLGATKCFDYKDQNVVIDIRKYIATTGQKLKHILDAAGSPEARTADTAASCGDEDANIVCATAHPKYPMPLATTEYDVKLVIPGKGLITLPARPEDAKRAQAGLLWAVKHYGEEFYLPKVTVVSGRLNEAIETIAAVGASKAGFGKYVVEHPLHE